MPNPGPDRRRPLVRTLTLAALLVIAAACGDGDGEAESANSSASTSAPERPTTPLPVATQEIDVTGTEYSFALEPDATKTPLRAGWTTVRFKNPGGEAHQIMFARLKDGVDLAELAEAGAGDSSGAGAIEFVDMLGGVSYIGPDQEITAMVDLPEGIVMAMCYVPNADGVAHALLGMSNILTVQKASESSESDASTTTSDSAPADVVDTIRITDGGYEIPDLATPGWYRVVNTDKGPAGTGLHELAVLRLEHEVGADEIDDVVKDLANNKQPSVGLEALGGLGAISPGFVGYLYLDLSPGDYLVVDFMPDARKPRPHLLDGYWTTFQI